MTKRKPNAKMGRPTKKTPQLLDTICERLSMGESLLEITNEDGMPERITVYRWLANDPDFSNKYAIAKEKQADAYEDMLANIAKTEPDVQRARLIIDTYKWTASKLKPKKYGNQIDVTSGGEKIPSPLLGGLTTTDQQ